MNEPLLSNCPLETAEPSRNNARVPGYKKRTRQRKKEKKRKINRVEINTRAYVATRLLLRWDYSYMYAVTLKTKVFGDYNHARVWVFRDTFHFPWKRKFSFFSFESGSGWGKNTKNNEVLQGKFCIFTCPKNWHFSWKMNIRMSDQNVTFRSPGSLFFSHQLAFAGRREVFKHVWSFLYKQCTSSFPLFQRNTNKQTIVCWNSFGQQCPSSVKWYITIPFDRRRALLPETVSTYDRLLVSVTLEKREGACVCTKNSRPVSLLFL